MISLGLDLSLTGPGVVFIEKKPRQKHNTITAVELVVPKDGVVWDRIDTITGQIDALLGDIGPPDVVTIENYGQGSHKNVAAFVKQVGVGTSVRMLLHHIYSLAWEELPPSSLKCFVTGNGKATKSQMCKQVASAWGYETKNDNIADAYGLAMFGLARRGILKIKPWQLDVLDRVNAGKK